MDTIQASLSLLAGCAQDLLARGFDVIPCHPHTKKPLYSRWQQREPAGQIRQALDEYEAFNLAVRGGGQAGLVAIDCEDEDTTREVIGWLDMAHDIEHFPVVRSASGAGSHIWLKCHNIPDGFATATLAAHIGQGEIRGGPGAYVMIPPSRAWSEHGRRFGEYTFVSSPDLFDAMQPVDWDTVIAPLAASVSPQFSMMPDTPVEELSLPIPLPYQPAPPLVDTLLAILQTAPGQQPIAHPNGTREPYRTRSEAEQAIITILILCGWPYPEIANLFRKAQPGHYRDLQNPRAQETYLKTSYRRALLCLIDTPERQPILAAYNWAYSPEWPLGSGLARLVYHYILLTAYKDARPDPVVPYSALRAATGASNGGLAGALRRLEEAGLIERLPGDPRHDEHDRILIRLDVGKANYSLRGGHYTKLPLWQVTHLLGQLSYAIGYVYCALSEQPQSIAELAEWVGSSRDRVVLCLRELEKLGLACQVHRYGWVAGEADVDDLCAPVALRAPQKALAPASRVLEALREFSLDFGRLLGLGIDEQDPVAVYVHVMSKVYGCKLNASKLSEARQEQLQDLVPVLQRLYRSGRLGEPSPYFYVLWVAHRYRRMAQEHGWPMIWINIVCSPKTLAKYAAEHPRLQTERVLGRRGRQAVPL